MATKSNGVPTGRFYLVIVVGITLGWVAGFFHGQDKVERKEAHIAMEQQEKVLDAHTEVYSSLPRSRDDSFKWLFDHAV